MLLNIYLNLVECQITNKYTQEVIKQAISNLK